MDDSIKLLEKIMDICAYRQKILASNIANADTPKYKAKDLNFQEELKRAVETDNQSYKIIEASTTMPNRDENTVNIEVEMTKVAETMLMYNTATQLISTKIRMIKSAVKGGS
ncbi:MAG TPA: flagellar basal body rod protein FlgB [Thermodesulfovibrio thiophilus]|uniref:flagellar basal body rod protein FlgB n=1 Tax=Thermodesulfovibrio thiophilus TaxID=340095 RepID=UPI0017A024B1|nr:flagellar basal body rod protein FlgB [Thermodesulfovibrio thiophilus]HHW20626.1 flagellar basal body rod protein FlgB [Thermodesulfovibrio thiophilus]HOA83047.1 flagellar basal body rod protein FlgB [Thermodesulfovibrio thiophilus]HQA03248.1 flagellar basal body rod protein FlgB [Thermodesulfovibrio thiophilus]HQD36176.1 flagellar basal body rod protein FlgB [Thermodesulfovibrio thiophilus]